MDGMVEQKALDRYLSPVDVWAIAFGCMVGWGVFAMPGNTFLPVAGPAGTIIALVIGTAVILVVGSNLAFLMGRSSMTGGVYTYTKEAFGRDHAFISTWFLCLSYFTIVFLNGTALFMVIRTFFGTAMQGVIHYNVAGNEIYLREVAVSVFVLAVFGLLFVVAKPMLQRLFTILSIVLVTGVTIVAVACLPHALSMGALGDFGIQGLNRGYAVFSIVILAPWAFVGFEVASFETAHFDFDIERSRRILVTSIAVAAFSYIAMVIVSVASVPEGYAGWQDYVSSLDGLTGVQLIPTFYAARSIMGRAGFVIMGATAVAAILTGIIGGYRAATRVLATMAEDRILSEKFSQTTYSVLFVMVVSVALSLLGRNTLNWFVDLTLFGAIVGFGYTSAAAYKIAKTEGDRRTRVTGMLGTVISCVFVIVQLVPHLSAMEAMGSEAFLLLALWCQLGFVFYWRTITRSSLTEYSGMSTSGVVLFSLLLYSAIMWLGKRLMKADSIEMMHAILGVGGVVLMVIVFVGLAVMLYVQDEVRRRHELVEREKIRAVEGSLAKSQFLFNMSHDIRTPMNAIIGYTNLALQEGISETVKGYLRRIEDSSEHLLGLINDILEMSRIESGKLELEYEPIDICLLFDHIRDLFTEQMRGKALQYEVHTGQVSDRYVWCDRKNLNRVLLNIISNAYKFTPEGGTVSVTLWEAGDGEDGYGSYEIRVQDSGIGMSREFADRMFNAFERERTSTVSGTEGTGLGLAITKNIIDLMGGTIEVLTAPGAGTTIIVRLKLRLADEADVVDREDDKPAEGSIDFTGMRVLLVEDNEINMEIAKMILEQSGFVVDVAEDGSVALDMVSAAEAGTYDLVLMDIQMPVMDGYEATRAIRALDDRDKARVPIVAMTANAFKEDEEAAADAGMQAHIAKPIDIDVMMKTIGQVLSEGH